MELRQLRYFVSIVRERSLGQASKKLGVAQPALTRQIHLLEEELGVELLHRTTKGVHPTEAGHRFREMAEQILGYIGEIKPKLTEFTSVPSGNVAIGLPPSLAFMLAPRLVEKAQQQYPFVTLRIIEGLSVLLAEWLKDLRLDLAVLTDYGPAPGIERHIVAEDELVFTGTPAELGEYDKTIPLKHIEHFRLLITHGLRSIISDRLAAEHIEPNYYMEFDSMAVAKEMVLRGQYCSIFPYSLVADDVQRGRLRALRFEGEPMRRRIITAVAANRPHSKTLGAIRKLIVETLKELPSRLPD